MILAWRAAESRKRDGLFRDPVCERAAEGLPPWPATPAVAFFADLVALRTRQLDVEVETAWSEGPMQAVVLGAGLDTRFWRSPPPRGTSVIEIDSEPVQQLARRVLPGGGFGLRRTAALPAGLEPALREARHDPERPTLWILEGLLEYLPGTLWESLARTMTAHSSVGSRALVTVLGHDLPERVGHDPSFPFRTLPTLDRVLVPLSPGWISEVLDQAGPRVLPQGSYFILSARRSSPPFA